MKRLLCIFLAGFAFTTQARATVTDVLDCKLAIVEANGEETIVNSNRIAVIRRPDGVRDGMTYSIGEARLDVTAKKHGVVLAGQLRLAVRHALKTEANGTGHAFQSTCFSPVSYLCDEPGCLNESPRDVSCGSGDPAVYGTRVSVVDGIPVFDNKQLGESEIALPKSYGVVRAACQHVGTYR